MLRQWNMEPTVIDGGKHVIEQIERRCAEGPPFELTLLDTMVPGMDGFGVAGQIRDDPDRLYRSLGYRPPAPEAGLVISHSNQIAT